MSKVSVYILCGILLSLLPHLTYTKHQKQATNPHRTEQPMNTNTHKKQIITNTNSHNKKQVPTYTEAHTKQPTYVHRKQTSTGSHAKQTPEFHKKDTAISSSHVKQKQSAVEKDKKRGKSVSISSPFSHTHTRKLLFSSNCRAFIISTNTATETSYVGVIQRGDLHVFDSFPALGNSQNIIFSNQNRGVKTQHRGFVVFSDRSDNDMTIRKYIATPTHSGADLIYTTMVQRFQPAVHFRPFVLNNQKNIDMYFNDTGYDMNSEALMIGLDSTTGTLVAREYVNLGANPQDIVATSDIPVQEFIIFSDIQLRNISLYDIGGNRAFILPGDADPTQISGQNFFFGGVTGIVIGKHLHIASVGVGNPVVGTVIARTRIMNFSTDQPSYTTAEILFSSVEFSSSRIYAPAGMDMLYGCSNFGRELIFWTIPNAFTTNSVPVMFDIETQIAESGTVSCDKIVSFNGCAEEIYVKLSNGDVMYSGDGGGAFVTVITDVFGDITGVTV